MAIKKYHITVDECCTTRWYKDAEHSIRHRENGPAVEYSNGDKLWYQNDQLHRIDGPAIDRANGHKEWWQNDLCHRTDGPAVEYHNGSNEWWLNGVELSKFEFEQAVGSYNE